MPFDSFAQTLKQRPVLGLLNRELHSLQVQKTYLKEYLYLDYLPIKQDYHLMPNQHIQSVPLTILNSIAVSLYSLQNSLSNIWCILLLTLIEPTRTK